MLGIRKLNSRQAVDYADYLCGRADKERTKHDQSDYYLSGSGQSGAEWFGSAAALGVFGLSGGAVDKAELVNALRGLHGQTGEQVRRPGFGLDGAALFDAVADLASGGGVHAQVAAAVLADRGARRGEVARQAGYESKSSESVKEQRRAWGLLTDRELRQLLAPLTGGGALDLTEKVLVDGKPTARFRLPIVNSYDFTVSAPKSVSVVWAAADEDLRGQIEQALARANHRMLEYAGQAVPAIQKRLDSDLREWVAVDELVYMSTPHHTARGVGEVPDPQLHIHNVVLGGTKDGQAYSINQLPMLQHRNELGALFRSQLAHELQLIGFEIENATGVDGRYFEVAGVPNAAVTALSQRTQQIASQRMAFIRDHGRAPSAAEEALLALETRAAKLAGHTVAEIEGSWRTQLAQHGLSEHQARELATKGSHRELTDAQLDALEERIAARMIEVGSTVTTTQFRAIVLEVSTGLLSPDGAMELVASATDDLGWVVPLEDDRVTPIGVRDAEQRILDTATRAGQQLPVPIPAQLVDQAIATHTQRKGYTLDVEQQLAVSVACSPARVNVIVGLAGTGKGDVIGATSDAVRATGGTLHVVAMSNVRAIDTGKQAHARARSIDSMDNAIANGYITIGPTDTIIVDEAGMVDTFRMATIMEWANLGARVVLVGDPEQLPAIGPGGTFEALTALEAVPRAELTQVYRARTEHVRDAQLAIRDGRARDAIETLDHAGALTITETTSAAREHLVDQWNQWRAEYGLDETMLVVHTSNQDLHEINALCQAERLTAGELGGARVAARHGQYALYSGDHVILRHAHCYPADGERVPNGSRGTIVDVNEQNGSVTLRVADGTDRRVTIPLGATGEKHDLWLDYASHIVTAQGLTVRACAELTDGRMTGKEGQYVSASRARDEHHLVTATELLAQGDEYAITSREQAKDALGAAIERSQRDQGSLQYSPTGRAVARVLPGAPSDDFALSELPPVGGRAPESVQLRQALQLGTPAYLERALGRRPRDPDARDQWLTKAVTIEQYRQEQSISVGSMTPARCQLALRTADRQVDRSPVPELGIDL